MESVKRYGSITGLFTATPEILEFFPGLMVYVRASDFDRVSAENLALREELAALKHPMNSAAIARKERDALQQRLTVQDQRVGELENALKNMIAAFDTPIRRRKLSSDFNDQAIASAWSALKPTIEKSV